MRAHAIKRTVTNIRGKKQILRKRVPHLFDDLPRFSSFPFVSGDLFHSCATTTYSTSSGGGSFCPLPRGSATIFATPDELQSVENAQTFLQKLSEHSAPDNYTLIVHNGDASLSEASIRVLAAGLKNIYSVNLTTTSSEFPNLHQIPIGLENFPWRGETYLRFFLRITQGQQTVPGPETRNAYFHSSFSPRTNPDVRLPLVKLLKAYGVVNSRASWKEFTQHLLCSKFVFSPPGNGLDCHRTWEAMAAGAVPILLRGTLTEKLASVNPIWEVDDWEEPLHMSRSDLDEKYAEVRLTGTDHLYAFRWLEEFRSKPRSSQI